MLGMMTSYMMIQVRACLVRSQKEVEETTSDDLENNDEVYIVGAVIALK